jgi:hypothetical protein
MNIFSKAKKLYAMSHKKSIYLTKNINMFKENSLKEHFLAKSIFGCLLSILRYLTILSQSNLHCRWKSEDYMLLAFLRRRLWVSCPETPVFTHRRLWVRDRRLRPKSPGIFFVGCHSPQIWGRRLCPESLAGARLRPETPALGDLARRLRSLDPEDSGLKRQQRLVHLLGLYKGFFYLKSRLRLTLSHLHCCQASKL